MISGPNCLMVPDIIFLEERNEKRFKYKNYMYGAFCIYTDGDIKDRGLGI